MEGGKEGGRREVRGREGGMETGPKCNIMYICDFR